MARIRRGERIGHYETVRRRKDGSFVDISLTVSPIYGSDGEIIGASKIARDITDRKRAKKFRFSLVRPSIEQETCWQLCRLWCISHRLTRPLISKPPSKAGFRLSRMSIHFSWSRTGKGRSFTRLSRKSLRPIPRMGKHDCTSTVRTCCWTRKLLRRLQSACIEFTQKTLAKYGSLSVPDGKVHTEAARLAEGKLFLRWTETGGPPVKQPERHGIGSRVMDAMLRGLYRVKSVSIGVQKGLSAR